MTNRADLASGAAPRALFHETTGGFSPMARGAQVAYAPDEEVAGGGLSLDAAIEHLNEGEDEPEEAAGDAAAADGEALDADRAQELAETNSEGEASSPDDAAGEAENPPGEGDEAEAAEGAETPLDAPLHWKPEAKAKWTALDPELQAEILAQEGPREAIVAKAKDKAAQAEQEIAGVARFAEELQSFLPQAVQTFRSRWGDNPDWVAYAASNGAEAMTVAKAQWEQERTQLQQVAQASAQAEETAFRGYLQTEFKALQTIAPHLADPVAGPARRTEVSTFLKDAGVPEAALKHISALELSLAHDAMLWRRAQAKSSPTPPAKPAAAATRPLTRGSAPAAAADPKARATQVVQTRFRKTGSIEDAVAFLNASE